MEFLVRYLRCINDFREARLARYFQFLPNIRGILEAGRRVRGRRATGSGKVNGRVSLITKKHEPQSFIQLCDFVYSSALDGYNGTIFAYGQVNQPAQTISPKEIQIVFSADGQRKDVHDNR